MREAVVAALHSVLMSALAARSPTPVVLRGETVPQRLPPGGLVVIHDGEMVEETPILSPLAWAIEHRGEVEVIAPTSGILDAPLVAIGTVITADRTIGGAVEWSWPGAPESQEVEFEGAAVARAALVPATLWFTVAGSPLA